MNASCLNLSAFGSKPSLLMEHGPRRMNNVSDYKPQQAHPCPGRGSCGSTGNEQMFCLCIESPLAVHQPTKSAARFMDFQKNA